MYNRIHHRVWFKYIKITIHTKFGLETRIGRVTFPLTPNVWIHGRRTIRAVLQGQTTKRGQSAQFPKCGILRLKIPRWELKFLVKYYNRINYRTIPRPLFPEVRSYYWTGHNFNGRYILVSPLKRRVCLIRNRRKVPSYHMRLVRFRA